MELAAIIQQYLPLLQACHAKHLLPGHRNAINAMLRCRTGAAGEMRLACSDCPEQRDYPLSCGHRSCPKCQNHETSRWLARQQAKLLPVEYFLVTFTLPRELRPLAWRHQKQFYALMLTLAAQTLKDFGVNPKFLGADFGLTAILHTHSRRLDYHPHVHVIVPGGGVNRRRKQWCKLRSKYLFNQKALAKVFRARLLAAIRAEGLSLPDKLPRQWVVDCKPVGRGEPALKYLSRYLYRGVIGENRIVANRDGRVTFEYLDSRTGETQYRTEKGEDFLWLVLQHVLPRGFRRVRDSGFLHGNAKRTLILVQYILRIHVLHRPARPRPVICCPRCQAPMRIVAIRRPDWSSG
ncbi:MAG: IS91 family transposase [Gammaproteobacteria bacterium]|nr:IS91 family transposase [Gammaproteobacteria bacterium]